LKAPSSSLRAGLVQQTNTDDRAANLQKSADAARRCQEQGAELIVFQELHAGLYFCQTEDTTVFDQAETIPGPSTAFFGALARELNCVLVLSLFEQRAPGLCHNTAVVLERDGSIVGKYRKMHIPDDPAYYEKFYFTRTNQPRQAGSTGLLGPMVPRSCPPDGAGRGGIVDLPHRHWLRDHRQPGGTSATARRLDHQPTGARGSAPATKRTPAE